MKTNRYPVLRIVAVVYKVLGIILGILTVLGACSIPFIGGSLFGQLGVDEEIRGLGIVGGLVIGLVILLYGSLNALFLYAAGEVLTLLMDLEANTRTTAALLERTQGN